MRLLRSASGFPSARKLAPDGELAVLNEALSLGRVSQRDLDLTLDWLARRKPAVETKLARRHLPAGSFAYYALTSVANADNDCEFARHGYLQEGDRSGPQTLLGLLCDAEGCPVRVEVREGRMFDLATVAADVDSLRQRLGLSRVVLVGARGMLTEKRVREEIAPFDNLGWISALPAPAVLRVLSEARFTPEQVRDRGIERVESSSYPGERLLARRNPLLRRERSKGREALLEGCEAALQEVRQAMTRNGIPLRGDAMKLRADRTLRQYRMRKHFRVEIKGGELSWERDQAKVAADAALDGLYVLWARVPPEELDDVDLVRFYEHLAAAGRPFQHWHYTDPRRGQAYALIGLLAYYLELHLRRQLTPLLYEEEDCASAEPRARLADDGETIWDFRGLLAELGTLPRHRVRFQSQRESNHAEVLLLTEPNALQRRAFDLLRIRASDYLPSTSTNVRLPEETGTASARGGSRSGS